MLTSSKQAYLATIPNLRLSFTQIQLCKRIVASHRLLYYRDSIAPESKKRNVLKRLNSQTFCVKKERISNTNANFASDFSKQAIFYTNSCFSFRGSKSQNFTEFPAPAERMHRNNGRVYSSSFSRVYMKKRSPGRKVEPLHNGHLGDRGKWPLHAESEVADMWRQGCNVTPVFFFRGVTSFFLFSFLNCLFQHINT